MVIDCGAQAHPAGRVPALRPRARHGTPERNRAYLIDDIRRDQHAPATATPRPALPAVEPDAPWTAPDPPQDTPDGPPRGDDNRPRPETALWDALVDAGPEGVSVGEMGAACGMARRWVYYRLQEHAHAGRAVQVRRGYWQATRPGDGPPAEPSDVTDCDRARGRARASRLRV
jgi:hypothetical protein